MRELPRRWELAGPAFARKPSCWTGGETVLSSTNASRPHDRLAREFPSVPPLTHLLSSHTTLRLGGPAASWAEPLTEEELVDTARDAQLGQTFVLGEGSNIVVADCGVPGTVVKVASRGIQCDRCTGLMSVQAGESWEELVELAVCEGLAGIECLSGIPGTVGAGPIQNIGAYGQALADTLVRVRAFDRKLDQIVELSRPECHFGYRSSVFKKQPERFVVLSVDLGLRPARIGGPINHRGLAKALGLQEKSTAPLADIHQAVLELRRSKGMLLDPTDPDTCSAGSFFLNPVVDVDRIAKLRPQLSTERKELIGRTLTDGRLELYAAQLIEQAGFHKGYGDPHGIAISSKHALALTNRGNGSTQELVQLAKEIAGRVEVMFGVCLTPEPSFVGHSW